MYAWASMGSVEGRAWASSLFWKQRAAGELKRYGLEPLDAPRFSWAVERGDRLGDKGAEIDPKTLAIARDVAPVVYDLLRAAPEVFFESKESFIYAKNNLEDCIPNPGLVAQLLMDETGHTNPNPLAPVISSRWGLVFIGGRNAIDQVNTDPDWFPSGIDDLKKIAGRLQAQTGLPYLKYVDTIPGSEWTAGSGSGGAFGMQFEGPMAVMMTDKYDQANGRLGYKYPPMNIFEPFMGTVLCTLFLSSEFEFRHGGADKKAGFFVPGYRSTGSDDYKIAVLEKWNPYAPEDRRALDAGYDYYGNFGRV